MNPLTDVSMTMDEPQRPPDRQREPKLKANRLFTDVHCNAIIVPMTTLKEEVFCHKQLKKFKFCVDLAPSGSIDYQRTKGFEG